MCVWKGNFPDSSSLLGFVQSLVEQDVVYVESSLPISQLMPLYNKPEYQSVRSELVI